MKKYIAVAVLMLGATLASAKDKQDYTGTGACLAVTSAFATPEDPFFCGLNMTGCFTYLGSANLPMKEIKNIYQKKGLEKLEGRGVKIVVTTKEAWRSAPLCN